MQCHRDAVADSCLLSGSQAYPFPNGVFWRADSRDALRGEF